MKQEKFLKPPSNHFKFLQHSFSKTFHSGHGTSAGFLLVKDCVAGVSLEVLQNFSG